MMFKQFQRLTLRVVDLVNSPRKTQRIMRDATVSRVILRDFYGALKSVDGKGYFTGGLSEASLRGSGGKFLITPGNSPIGLLDEKEMMAVSISGSDSETLPDLPRHASWHRAIYQHSGANAVILCQPVHACLIAAQGKLPKHGILSDADAVIDASRCVKVEELDLGEGLPDDFLLLVKGIGVLAWGCSLNDLLGRIEIFERLCELTLLKAG